MQKIPKCVIDLTITSPPYDKLRTYKDAYYTFPFEEIAEELYRITKIGGVLVWIVNDATVKGSETGTSFRQALYFMQCGFKLHDTMIYGKKNIPCYDPRNKRYKNGFEYMFVFCKDSPLTYNPICDVVSKKEFTNGITKRNPDGKMRKPKDVKFGKTQARSNIWMYQNGYMQTTKDKIAFKHPALFPEQLVQDHIKSWTNEGDLVYDCFMGSGTTAKIAKQLNRKYIGSEINKEYYDIAKQRLETFLF